MPPRTTGTLRVPRKRSRRGSESTPGPDPEMRLPDNITKDEDFWFEDGNIVLVAQDVAFRVYKGPLMRHSTVFQDMFAFPSFPALPQHLPASRCSR
ncbi:hypothetical protein NUW54_g11906 [Trametes sanguinea]|uniref:Uncharacterized protein n=1 Tax=Trametes sanguinea TaxID=158606 RepID=A0ACC1N6D7_9APHY|nr:hypothetical protein NUW54_g11906 [Trametes sanguinea]